MAFGVEHFVLALPFGFVIAGVFASTLLAQRSLHDHVARVALALERDGLDGGRQAVSHIVGRDPNVLDEAGVSRAAIESLAENFSDGIIAPAFWVAVGGRGTLYGAVVGALLVNYAKTYLTGALPEMWLYALGALFVLVTVLLPRGIVGLLRRAG